MNTAEQFMLFFAGLTLLCLVAMLPMLLLADAASAHTMLGAALACFAGVCFAGCFHE